MKHKSDDLPPLEHGLRAALCALDNQIARELQRSPAQLEQFGVLKWEPFSKRIELLTSFLLNELGGDQIKIDSLLVLAQALSKTLKITVEDLEISGLGKVRTDYCKKSAENVASDMRCVIEQLKQETSFE